MIKATVCDAKIDIGGIWIIAESAGDDAAESTSALVWEARRHSGSLGPVSVLTKGRSDDGLTSQVAHCGADRALIFRSAHAPDSSARALAYLYGEQIRACAPRLVLFPSTKHGVEIAGFIAALYSLPLVNNAVRLNVDAHSTIQVTKPVYGGQMERTFASDPGLPLLVAMKQATAAPDLPDRTRSTTLVEMPCAPRAEDNGELEVISVLENDTAVQDLSEAQVVVACGRGLGHRDNLRLIEDLATALNGTIGATRVAVDAGWLPFSRQIGQTAKSIAPRLYIACGISGASHHVAGVQGSKLIVAINKDRNAPIFRIADIAVVGDMLTIIPEMLAEIRRYRSKPEIPTADEREANCASSTTP